MNSTPGHVCQPTSRADTLPDLYSALSVTVSTFFDRTIHHHPCARVCPSRATIKVLPQRAPVYPALQTTHKHSHLFQPPLSSIFMASNQNDVLSWTSQDPRQSQLFSPWGVVYRFQVCTIDIAYAPMALIHLPQTETNAQGQSTTTVWRAIRANREDRVAKLEWGPGGGLGRAVIGKVRPSLRGIPHLTCFLRSHSITEPPAYGRLGPPGLKDACTFQLHLD
jgi:hypothetical protein